jgi:hypothetical protein
MERPQAEIVEIERHKYFLSQKMGYDVGWEAAASDWEQSYGRQWRAEHVSPVAAGAEASDDVAVVAAPCDGPGTECGPEESDACEEPSSVRADPAQPPRGPSQLRKLLRRVFSWSQ